MLPLLCDQGTQPVVELDARVGLIALLCQLAEQVDQDAGNQCVHNPLQNEWQEEAVDILRVQGTEGSQHDLAAAQPVNSL